MSSHEPHRGGGRKTFFFATCCDTATTATAQSQSHWPQYNPHVDEWVHAIFICVLFSASFHYRKHFICVGAKNASKKADVARVLIGVIVKHVAAMLRIIFSYIWTTPWFRRGEISLFLAEIAMVLRGATKTLPNQQPTGATTTPCVFCNILRARWNTRPAQLYTPPRLSVGGGR